MTNKKFQNTDKNAKSLLIKMDQGSYPNLDTQGYNQPYGQGYYASPVESYNYQSNPHVIYDNQPHNHKQNLNEPLIEKNHHRSKKQNKRIAAVIIACLGLAIEIGILYN